MTVEISVYLIVIIILLLLVAILLFFILLNIKKSNKKTPDWSLVYPELAGMYDGFDEDLNPAAMVGKSLVSETLDSMLEETPVVQNENEKKFQNEISSTEHSGETVLCTAYAPNTVETDEEFIIAAFISSPKQKKEVEEAANLIDEEIIKRAEKFLNLQISNGDKIIFNLQVDGCEIDDPVQEAVWQGEITSAEFGVKVLSWFKGKKLIAKLTIAINGIPAGNIKFRIKVQKDAAVFETIDAPVKTTRYKTAFISYASPDRNEVLRRTQMLSASGITFFQDVMNLKPGELWENSLYKEIDNCDVFYLFWSTSAKNSKWVKEEYRYAQNLQASGKEIEIIPIPIEGPPVPLPPDELSHLHFNDGFLYFIQK